MAGFNWLDFLIGGILLLYVIEGFSLGFWAQTLDLFGFILSFLIGLKTYAAIGSILIQIFSIPQSFSNAMGFFIGSFIAEIVLGILLRRLTVFIPVSLRGINHFFGVIPGLLSGAILLSFLLTLIVTLPFSSFLKSAVSSSRIGSILVAQTQGLDKELNTIFGPSVLTTLNFLTVEPKSDQTVSLHFKVVHFTVDTAAEEQMFAMVNKERISRNLSALTADEALREVGRSHCKDMLAKGYFSHYTIEGLSPFDRIERAGIPFVYAGENLALSPNTDIAMKGLMNSPGHKANILSENFGKIGVGVIDGGIYGEMFCQEFTD